MNYLFLLIQFILLNKFVNEGIEIIPCKNIEIKCDQSRIGNYVIKSNKEYKEKLIKTSLHRDCPDYEFPEIDFEKYNLIGVVFAIGGCKPPEINYNLIKVDTNEYKLIVDVIQKGYCEINFQRSVWCLYDKTILNDGEINFRIDKNVSK